MNLLKSFATVGGMTMMSRVLGFVRDILIAAVLGTGPVADAFFVAFKFPNLFRRLFAEGAFNSAFVPLFAKRLEGEGEKSARQFAEEAFAVLLTVLIVFTAIAQLAMPWLMYGIAPGFSDTPDKFDMAVVFTQIAFPYLLFMSLVALLSGVLNSLGKFAAAAFAPVLLNIILISTLLFAAPYFDNTSGGAGLALVWGVSAAGVAQLAMLMWAAHRAGFMPRLRMPKMTPGVKRLIVLGIPGVIAGGIAQINLLIGTIIASLQDGAVSWLYYADRVYQLPLGVIGIAIGIVLLPDLARRLRADDEGGAMWSQNRAMEFSMLLTLPAAAALIAIPGPIIETLFERGAFDAADTLKTQMALAAFAVGLPAFVLIKVFSPGFFARENTVTPMRFAAAGIAVNIAGSLILFYQIGFVGIAIATSMAAWVNAGLLWFRLAANGHYAADERLKKRLPMILVASAAMGGLLWATATYAGPTAAAMMPGGWTAEALGILALGGLVAGGGLVYALLCQITGAARLSDLKQALRR
ncbi:murein biosynthesis integral membrane protein MurJ [Pyruvatibacter sp.]|uniref:murein biosynthesis integral membrane protein MurJ n=1 Tax=Pyruvatibacter sp. TaxID=1981328 RepID=UPI0032639FB0